MLELARLCLVRLFYAKPEGHCALIEKWGYAAQVQCTATSWKASSMCSSWNMMI